MSGFTEDHLEIATLDWFRGLGYSIAHGPDIAPDGKAPERATYAEVVLVGRLKAALAKINPHLPSEAIDEAAWVIMRAETPSLIENNQRFHALLTDGVSVSYRRADGTLKGDKLRVIDLDNLDNNDWLAVNQFSVQEMRGQARRPDVVVFINGLPLAVIELKNPADEDATVWSAFNQLQTYKAEISSLFAFNELLVISDGLEARLGSLTADRDRYMPWRTIDGNDVAPATQPQLEVLLKGVFDRRWFLDLVRHFVVFENDGKTTAKKLAGYHQFHAVRKAVAATVKASAVSGDRRAGVVWHTQGSGKSLSMVFYAGSLIDEQAMANPTIVVLTDRNDLDDQLFGTFSRCKALLRQDPTQADSRDDLRVKLQVASGRVVFTTIQKFMPDDKGGKYDLLSDRRNIVVVADEAHRSQYDFIDGFARHMRDALPNASFIGFTGTPIEKTDANTRAVFGNYIDIYDIQRAIEDKATVPIYYEGRLAKINLDPSKSPKLDDQFEEATEGEEVSKRERLKTKWAALEALVGSEERVALVARDIVDHFEQRLEAIDGKAMVVTMSRRICMDLYDAIIKLRPSWRSDDDDKGVVKVVMTGNASEGPRVAAHARNKPRREALAKRFKDSKDPMKIVIVRDMWLTGFDCPCLHTMYLDKPMRGHGLMQAIARVNRVFKDKPGGLVVDYLGIADQLKQALAIYTESGGKGETAIDQEQAVEVMLEKFEVVEAMFHDFDSSKYFSGTPAERLAVIPAAIEHVLKQKDGKERFLKAVTELSKAFALSVPHPEALAIRDQVGFYQTVRAGLVKATTSQKTAEELDAAVRQIVSQAVAGEGIVDIFAAAGLKSPDISILSDEFLAEVRGLPQKNLALELLRKLLNDEIKLRSKRNVVEARSFKEMLEGSIKKYQNRAIETAQVIQELIDLAKQLKKAQQRGQDLGLNDDEVAFYDALAANESARIELGDDALKMIAREVALRIKENVTIDWTIKETVRASLRATVKRILRKYGYPPDKQEAATDTVLEQAEVLCGTMTGG
ncbi:MAG: type I restriction endonuclease subunit R [Phycisphaerae bacterium]|nr:type I restriction endonuclease subunit R [Phycisphaerae bacterium]